MRIFAQKHVWGIVCALLAGVILVLPQIILPYSLGQEYKGVLPLMLDDEDIYRARIHEVLDGYPSISSPYLHEYKNTSTVVVPPIHEWLYALPAFLFGLSLTIGVSKFIFPVLLFLFTYLLLRKVLEEDDRDATLLASLTGAFLVTLGTDLIDYQHLGAILRGDMGQKAIMWERIVNPITGAVELFGFLLVLAYTLHGTYKQAFYAGVILAMMVGYFFSFAIAYTILGSLIFIYFVLRNYERVKLLLITALSSLVLDIPYWWSTLHSVQGEEGQLLASRNGMFFTHEAVVNKVLLASSILFLASSLFIFSIKRFHPNKDGWIFSGALLLGSWLAFNQQILTGKTIWYHHFVQYVVPLSYVALIIAAFYSLRLFVPKIWQWLMYSLIVVSLAYGVLTSWAGALPYRDELLRQQNFSEVFHYLNSRAGKDCVVYVYAATESLEKNIPAYTHCDVYSTSYVFIGIPKERILHNFFIQMRFSEVTNENAAEYLLTHEDEVRHVSFENWGQLFGRGVDEWYLTQVEYLSEAYQLFLKEDFKQQLQKYRIDYLVTETPLPITIQEQLTGLFVSTTTQNHIIYTFSL